MAVAPLGTVLRHIRHMVVGPSLGERTDAELLKCFAEFQDEAAFEALVRRHGPMVHGVCRRTLRDPHDIEDAFQATFLVLVRKASAIGRRELVGNWLYGVAYRVALKARVCAAKRRTHERQVEHMPELELPATWTDRDLRQALDEEVHRLPKKYRSAVVLCYLEGKSNEEAAEQLRCPAGTVKSRLSRARDLLRDRFARRGLAMSAGAVASLLAQETASASVPGLLVANTVQAALVVAAGEAAAAGVVPASVASLTEGVIHAMFLNKLKVAAAVMVAVSIVGSGVGFLTHRALAEKPAAAADKPAKAADAAAKPDKPASKGDGKEDKKEQGTTITGVVTKVDAGTNSLSLIVGSKAKEKQPEEQSFKLAAGAKVFLPRSDGKKEEPPQGKLSDVQAGHTLHLQLSADKFEILRIDIHSPSVNGIVKSVDAGKNTLTVTLSQKKPAEEQTYTLAPDAKIALPTQKKNEASEGKLSDLTEGVSVSLTLSLDQKTAHQVAVHAPSVSGNVKAVDAAKRTITLVSKGKEQQTEQTFVLAGDAKIYLPGLDKAPKGTKESKPAEEGKLSDLAQGLGVVVNLSFDRKQALAIQVQAPSVGGNLRSVDAAQNTITITFKGEGGQQEKTFAVAKDARITLVDGGKNPEGKLSDLSDGLAVVLNLSLDQTTVRAINASGPGVNGTVKSVDAGSKTITITMKEDGNLVDKPFEVAKAVGLTDVNAGVEVSLQLSVDKKTVIGLHVHKEKQKGSK